ncbi:MAG: DUF3127 domain-containing protein [Dysgonamonadaceae bacterium]|jgi:hypothetical protein|nr:DUF3127 domain-containing protein [Dysgonamonadaceae bacterium]
MQLTAKLVEILPAESGMGKNGEWKKQSIIVETEGQYPKKVCITVWGDKINSAQWQPGLSLTVDFDIESREFNGRWYTDVKAWKIEPAGIPQPQPETQAPEPPVDYMLSEPQPPEPASPFDDLPF